MEPLSALAGFISLCNAAIAAGTSFQPPSFETDELRILEHGAHHGIAELVRHETLLTVWTDGKLFTKQQDPSERIRYLSAFQSLCKAGHMYPEGDTRFTFSHPALQRAKAELGERFDSKRAGGRYTPYLSQSVRKVLDTLWHRSPEEQRINFVRSDDGDSLTVAGQDWFYGELFQSERCHALLAELLDGGYARPLDSENEVFGPTLKAMEAMSVLKGV